MSFGSELRRLRSEKGWTQEYLAKELNLSKANISKYESDQVEPNLETLARISTLFRVNINALLGLNEYLSGASVIQLRGIDFILYNEAKDLIEEEKEDVLDYIRFKKSKKPTVEGSDATPKTRSAIAEKFSKVEREQIAAYKKKHK